MNEINATNNVIDLDQVFDVNEIIDLDNITDLDEFIDRTLAHLGLDLAESEAVTLHEDAELVERQGVEGKHPVWPRDGPFPLTLSCYEINEINNDFYASNTKLVPPVFCETRRDIVALVCSGRTQGSSEL